METNVIYNEDCVEGMKERLPDNSIDLIVNDPPYNIGKDDWDKIDNYIEWCGKWISQCERVLKDNGSFYFFHNDFEVLAELQNEIRENTDFVFKQLIVWNKRFKGASNKGFLDGFVEVNDLRNYQKMAEYCLFYTFQDKYIDNKLYIEAVREIQKYVKDLIYKYGGNVTNANEFYCKWSGKTGNYRSLFFGKTQPVLYTEEQYKGLKRYIKSLGCDEKLKSYSEILDMVDKEKFKQKRYTFNNQKTHHSVWNYEIAEKKGHLTPKPLPLIENILKHSSNEGDIVLDCFGGSGTTAKACQNLKRQYILFETNEDYVELTRDRLKQLSLFEQAK